MTFFECPSWSIYKKKRWYNIEEEDDDNDDDNDDELVEVQQLHSLKGRGIRIGSMDKFVTKKKKASNNELYV